MTNESVMEHIEEMLPDVIEKIKEQAEHYLNSGAVDTENYEDDYRLSKIILCACLKETVEQYMPYTKADKNTMNNLLCF